MPRVSASRNRRSANYTDVPAPAVNRSRFNRSHSCHTAFNPGYLIPVFREELLPGDSITLQPTVFARLTTMEVPVFSNVYLDVHYFAFSHRHVWDDAEEFFGAEPGGPGTRVDRTTPKLDMTLATGSAGVAEDLFDYLGIPPGVNPLNYDTCPHNFLGRGYAKTCDEWYKDSEIEAPYHYDTDAGPDDPTDYPIRRRNKMPDRFTTARPWPYKGPDINISLGSSAPLSATVSADGDMTFTGLTQTGTFMKEANTSTPGTAVSGTGWSAGTENLSYDGGLQVTGTADLSSAVGPTVNDLRLNLATQHLFEMFARGSSARYVELNHTVFGVKSPDSRLQNSEYIGGATARLYVNPVSVTTNLVNQPGDQYAYGVAMGSGRPFTYSAVEHGYIIGIASIRTELLYSEGLDRDFRRHTRFDFFWPAFQGLGEQPIRNEEVYWQGAVGDQNTFGYEPRYQEYRERMNMVTGKMRPAHPTTLANFHLGQEFGAAQNLNKTFIQEDPPIDRVTTIASGTEPSFKVDIFTSEFMVRPISAQGRPGLPRL